MKALLWSALVFLALASSSAFAMQNDAVSYVYFDSQGNVVGQSINTCFNANPRTYVGVWSEFYRTDTYGCTRGVSISGTSCITSLPSGGPDPGSTDPQGGTVCTTRTSQGELPTPGFQVGHLPPGMTLEQSCDMSQCGTPPFYDPFRWSSADVHSGLPPH